MFPNPQAALPLPARPDLEQYKKLAKELLRASKSTDSDAIRNCSRSSARASGSTCRENSPLTAGQMQTTAAFASMADVASFGNVVQLNRSGLGVRPPTTGSGRTEVPSIPPSWCGGKHPAM